MSDGTEIVVGTGLGASLLGDGKSTFVPVLRDDMLPEQRQEVIRDTLVNSLDVPDRLGVMQGELLYEVSKNGYWKEWTYEDDLSGEIKKYDSFEDYTERELEMKGRKAAYLISIYEKFVVQLGIPQETLRGLQWSKAKELVPVIDEDNWNDLLSKLPHMTMKEVKAMVKKLKGVTSGHRESSSEPDEKMLRKSFSLTAEQAENLESALKVASALTASDKDGNNIDLICTDFIAGAAGTGGLEGVLDKIDVIKASLERAFGVTIKIEEIDAERFEKLAEVTA